MEWIQLLLPQEGMREVLLRCLTAMREYGYGYAIIGSVGPVEFYQKTCNATVIPDSDPGIYKDFLRGMEKRAEKH